MISPDNTPGHGVVKELSGEYMVREMSMAAVRQMIVRYSRE